MRWVSCHAGRLHVEEAWEASTRRSRYASTGEMPLLKRGQMHELLVPIGFARTVTVALLQAAETAGCFVWCGTELEPYPPALAAAGVPLDRVYLIRPRSREDLLWAAVETLRCPGVGVTVVAPDRLTPVEARRLQLAAERGNGLGLLIRRPDARVHAAGTRWLVHPEPGEAFVQRWRLQLVHGHGRPVESLTLEMNRETNHVRTVAVLADRPCETTPSLTA